MTDETGRVAPGHQLILMRHAKSDWGDESLSDHDRPLNKRGRRDAPRMAQWLAVEDRLPDRVLVSSSARTRETIALMVELWREPPTIVVLDQLYHASPGDIFAAINGAGNDSERLMVLAHNPGMSNLVSHFAGSFTEMPTAALAIFDIECDSWSALNPSTPVTWLDQMHPKLWAHHDQDLGE